MTTKPMLIVAVEPDANQAKRLASMAKRYLRAEFIVEATATAALKGLRDRVPDLILTPVLLSSRDEMLLTERLRVLGAAAAHVQTLAIPILSSAQPTIGERGSRFIRRRQQPEPEDRGCELSVFADQVKIYLERAAAEQQARTDLVPDAPIVAETHITHGTAVEIEPIAAAEESAVTLPLEEPVAPIDESAAEDTYDEWLPVELSPLSESEPPSAPLAAPDPSQARALEAEFGLVAVPGHAPQLWRVGLEEPPAPDPAPTFRTAAPMRRRPRAARPAPPIDDWAYFDPTQSGFKALIRRLDEIAAQYVSTEAADVSGGPALRP